MADTVTIFLRRQEAAAVCGVSIGTLDRLLRDHGIDVVRVGKAVLIPDDVHQEDRDRAVMGFGGDSQSCLTALSREDLISETRQPIAYSFENRRVIVHDENGNHRGTCHR